MSQLEEIKTFLGRMPKEITNESPISLLRWAVEEIERLRAALSPFAAIGKTITTNWPGDCRLRIDTRRDGSEFHCYHGEPEEHLGILPTLDQWREAAEAARDD